MNKKALLAGITAGIISFAFLVGCGGSKVSVKDDLANYDAKVAKIIESTKALQSVDNPKDLSTKMAEMKKQIEEIKIETTEVKDLNKLILEGYEGLVSGFSDVATAQEKNDAALGEKAAAKADEAQKKMDEFIKKAEELAKKEGLTLTMKNFD